MTMTVQQFIDYTRSFMDATDSARWDDDEIVAAGGIVMDNEWGGILEANQYYRFNECSVTTDSSGRIAIADLTTGTGDDIKNFFRILTGPTDGNILWQQTDLRYVPLGTQTNYQNPYEYLFYLAGDFFQLLPVASGTALTVAVNWIPVSIADLAGVSSVIDFPAGNEFILPWTTAGTLLLKGGTEAGAATNLFSLANDARRSMLGTIARRTVRPTGPLFNDSPAAWGG